MDVVEGRKEGHTYFGEPVLQCTGLVMLLALASRICDERCWWFSTSLLRVAGLCDVCSGGLCVLLVIM